MVKITQKFREQFHTDSDVMDYAEENNLSCKELSLAISLFDAKGTPCDGCKNVVLKNMSPCISCSRDKRDYYERVLN